MRSLFLRMRLVHWIGVALLVLNALFLTDNPISKGIQLLIAVVIFIHDLDEKINGVEPAKKMISFLKELRLNTKLSFKLPFSAEFEEMKNLINAFVEKLQKALDIEKILSSSQQITHKLHDKI